MAEQAQELLVQGAQALIEGRRTEARDLLIACVTQDENNEEAWLWLSGAVDDTVDVQTALENCLALNPNNSRAQQGLEWVRQHSS